MSVPLPQDPADLLSTLDARGIDAWLDGLSQAEILDRLRDLEAQARSWRVLLRAVRARQRCHTRNAARQGGVQRAA